MLSVIENKKIFIASNPVNFRMSINGLAELVQKSVNTWLHDGSIYVFYNKNRDKIKCLFWDRNGFVLYYKRLDNTRFKFRAMTNDMQSITAEELDIILSGYDPMKVEHLPRLAIEGNYDHD